MQSFNFLLDIEFLSLYGFLTYILIHSDSSANAPAVPDG
jgi:hypothetical protein